MLEKIIFVRPPFKGMTDYCPPHMGIACLYGACKDFFGNNIDFELIDALPRKLSVEDVITQIRLAKPTIVCLSIKTMQVGQAIEIINALKNQNLFFICGGNHVSVEPQLFVENGADFCIVGEGEYAIVEIIYSILTRNQTYMNCKNVIASKNALNKILDRKPNSIYKFDLHKLSKINIGRPNWGIFKIDDYNENIHINKSIPALQVMASRGCPYKCSFCSSFLTWGTSVKYRSPEDVLNEIIDNICKYGINHMHFYDDNLLLNRDWIIQFIRLIKEKNVSFSWICLSRPEIIYKNRDLLPELKEVGCKGFELGFETYSTDIYEKMHKKNSYDNFLAAYNELVKNEFEMIEFLIMAFYIGETIESLFSTYQQLEKFRKSGALFEKSRYFATPFLGTEFYNIHDNEGHDLIGNNYYKYAVYLNYMPDSFLSSTSDKLYIDENIFELNGFIYDGFDHIIYEDSNRELLERIPYRNFARLFNEQLSNRGTIQDICDHISNVYNQFSAYAIEEYVGRMVEFAASCGALKAHENTIL